MTIVDKEKIQELVNRSATGDKNAYRELFEIYYKRVYNLAFNIMNNREDAEEVLQEAFVKAYWHYLILRAILVFTHGSIELLEIWQLM